MTLTKRSAKKALGIETDLELADFFGISKQAVSQWGDDEAELPEGRQWQVRALRPDLFDKTSFRSDG